MEINKSETDIPRPIKTEMDFYCDNNNIIVCKEKTEDSIKNMIYSHENEKNLMNENTNKNNSSESEESHIDIMEQKVPSKVQDWINHLPIGDSLSSKDDSNSEQKEDGQETNVVRDHSLARAQLSREASLQSTSSLDSLLDSRRPDPVEIFLNLGFGSLPGIDTENCRIPKRFLVPSKCKGGDWNEFLKRELIQAQNFECSSLGFRGLSGPSYRRPSAIVANIMEKLRERTVPQPHNRSRFSTVAKMVLNEKSVLNKLTPDFQSVLSPDSRKFLQNQGKKSPEVPRRRIIFGQKSFAFAHDGEFVELESLNANDKNPKESAATLSSCEKEDTSIYPNSEVLLKLRRSSLQKQKKVEDDTGVDDVFFVVGEDKHSAESAYNNSTSTLSANSNNSPVTKNNDCVKKTCKIPRRFLSSGNLKELEESLSDSMRWEVEKEILSLSQKIKSISNQDLPSVLQQVKELRSKLENNAQEPTGL